MDMAEIYVPTVLTGTPNQHPFQEYGNDRTSETRGYGVHQKKHVGTQKD